MILSSAVWTYMLYYRAAHMQRICVARYLCVCVCFFFVPYFWSQFWADLHEIWLVASLYPTDGHGGGWGQPTVYNNISIEYIYYEERERKERDDK